MKFSSISCNYSQNIFHSAGRAALVYNLQHTGTREFLRELSTSICGVPQCFEIGYD
eukprot:UN17017